MVTKKIIESLGLWRALPCPLPVCDKLRQALGLLWTVANLPDPLLPVAKARFEIYFLSNDCLKTLVTQTCSLPILTVLLIIEMLVSWRNIYKYFLLHLIRYIIIFLGSGIFFINPLLYYDIISIYYKKYWFKHLNRFYWPKIIIEIQNTQNM